MNPCYLWPQLPLLVHISIRVQRSRSLTLVVDADAGSLTLLDLSEDTLRCVLALLPAREAFCMGRTCKAFAAALRSLGEISVDITLDLATEEGEPAGQPVLNVKIGTDAHTFRCIWRRAERL